MNTETETSLDIIVYVPYSFTFQHFEWALICFKFIARTDPKMMRGLGVTFAKSYVNVPANSQKSDFLCASFSPNYVPTHQYTIFHRKARNFAQI